MALDKKQHSGKTLGIDNMGISEAYKLYYPTIINYHVDNYGFILEGANNPQEKNYEDALFKAKLINRWRRLIKKALAEHVKINTPPKITGMILGKNLLKLGIPMSLKSTVWLMICNEQNPVFNWSENYNNQISLNEKDQFQIHVDIQRTFRNHYLFNQLYGKGQCDLYSLLGGISKFLGSECGYCQGMSDIGGFILMHVDESKALSFFKHLITHNNLERLFNHDGAKILKIIEFQDALFIQFIKHIYDYLKSELMELKIVFIPWYLTFFTRFKIELSTRIWDYLVLYGFHILMYFAAGIMLYFENEIFDKKGDVLLEFLLQIESNQMDEERIINIANEFIEISKWDGKIMK